MSCGVRFASDVVSAVYNDTPGVHPDATRKANDAGSFPLSANNSRRTRRLPAGTLRRDGMGGRQRLRCQNASCKRRHPRGSRHQRDGRVAGSRPHIDRRLRAAEPSARRCRRRARVHVRSQRRDHGGLRRDGRRSVRLAAECVVRRATGARRAGQAAARRGQARLRHRQGKARRLGLRRREPDRPQGGQRQSPAQGQRRDYPPQRPAERSRPRTPPKCSSRHSQAIRPSRKARVASRFP